MEQVHQYTPDTPALDAGMDPPLGDHPLEIAARRGIGPLSQLGLAIWHGDSTPCVSCGQIVRRGAVECEDCGQVLSEEMLEKMRAHAGPWYVLEHLRPFPGVSLERIIKQIRRGLITEVSIVRGPSTDYQWRYAVETPGICRYFGKCWQCHHAVGPADTYCPACLSYLSFEKPAEPRPVTRGDGMPPSPADTLVQPIAPQIPRPLPQGATGVATAFPTTLAVGQPIPPAIAPMYPLNRPPVAGASPQHANAQATNTGRTMAQLSAGSNPGVGGAAELARLADAVQAMDRLPRADETSGMGAARAGWIGAISLVLAVLILIWATSARGSKVPPVGLEAIPLQAATSTTESH